ncbi:HNH endonuclease signature motif containing protein [Rhodococcus sp. D-1]|uniref:HNH endonuclease signature motif containing protein n=1 Tax=Rhodococcus sp. D-1 TaxID=1912238 RepID=UPI00097727B3|nr:HNH endonuclease signature motif containing protein [Rhodococcus sp. D-1]OMQ28585.1 hypothetical protein BK799_29690 [Rhodococcus sp. D-1]
MWKVKRPAFDAQEVFEQCISRISRPDLSNAAKEAGEAAKSYEDAILAGTVHELKLPDFQSKFVTVAELKLNYTSRMVKATQPGRYIYDALFNAVEDDRCPMCGHREIRSLDHALPKAHYPLLSVVPINLVPCCSDCNRDKKESRPTKAENVFLNPYFEDLDKDIWLVADIVEGDPAGATFDVDPPAHWPDVLAARVENHFDELGLGALYAAQAGPEIRAQERCMERAFARAGVDGVREDLADKRDGRRDMFNNSWQGALFHALYESDWYCKEGFRSSLPGS